MKRLTMFLGAVVALLSASATTPTGPKWLSDAVFYQIYPSSFQDSDGNGIGDLPGIISRLDYIQSLGVNALWLNPVYESGWFDGGYDIIDFYRIDPRFGTNSDMVRLIDEAHKRGLRVCLDLVAGHTSDRCRWFVESATADPNSRYSDYYIWPDSISAAEREQIRLRHASAHPASDTRGHYVESPYPRARYYMKNYFECQPALNYGYAHPDPSRPWEQAVTAPGPQAVRRELRNIMAFWFDKGVDGFRVDMASSLVKGDPDRLLWRQTATYSATFGSPVYAFNEGEVHFIVLNNVYGRGVRGYEGRVSESQLQFVREDLAHVSPSRLVVLVMHIPLAVTRNRDELFAAVGARPVLALTAHLHRVMRDFHRYDGRTIPELGVGATCGFWWVGERDWEGVPMALQQGGTPRNYFVLDFDGPRYTFRCKGVGLDDHRQMTVHVVGIDSLDHRLRDLRDVAPRQALITVWGGCDSTRVRCRVDGGAWTLCQRASVLDPNAARVREQNLSKGYPTPYSRRNPIRHLSSPQIWSLPLSEAQCKGAHVIEVQADDSYGLRAHALRPYCYVEPAR